MENKIRLYRFYNILKGMYGNCFGMCDECRSKYKVPFFLVLKKLNDDTDLPCLHGNHKEKNEK